jgi:queuosine precursor transporter
MEKKYGFLFGLFIAAIILANLMGTKISYINFFGFYVEFSVGLLVFPITFLITDSISEVFGKERANELVNISTLVLVFLFLVILFASALPFAERSWVKSEEFNSVFSSGLRMIFASVVAFFFSQKHDVFAFHFWKNVTKGKHLWFRNTASTVVSQAIDSFVFMFLAFYMATPKFTIEYVIALALPYYFLKVLLAFFDTPFVYVVVHWLRKT